MIGVLLIPTLLLTCCTEDAHVENDKVNLTFDVDLMEVNEGHLRSTVIPPGAMALISVETEHGEVVVDQQEVAIRRSGDGYQTDALRLPTGSYRLVDLMVVDESDEVVFAAPREGSALSREVVRSLPYEITGESRSDIRLSLLDTRKRAPKHFGYDCFRGKPHTFKVQVFTAEENNSVQRTSAHALIMKGIDTLRMYRLTEHMNFITFRGNPGETYSLVVVKDSYSRFAKNFTFKTIPAKPLKVVLQPALSVVGVTTGDQNYFAMQLDPAWDIFDFQVDWGDGTNETWTSGVTTIVEHNYAYPGQYFISITGHGLDSVVLVGNLAGSGRLARLGMKHLVNLSDFRIEYGASPEVVDLSHSKRLNEIRLYPTPSDTSPYLEQLLIPNDANIYLLELVGQTSMKPESLNKVIDNLHHQVVNNPRSGDFIYSTWEDHNTPIAPPSAEAIEKLKELKNVYNWLVVPDPDGVPL